VGPTAAAGYGEQCAQGLELEYILITDMDVDDIDIVDTEKYGLQQAPEHTRSRSSLAYKQQASGLIREHFEIGKAH
jgi:hypothetical protein